MTAGYPAAPWSGRRCNGCWRISREGLVDVVVVYKVDRLTRSLADFAKMVEVFDVRGVSFVAVTQQFNTTTSMGRLTLNVLLSFAQFEREVTGERIRDKIAAPKRKGMWMGGTVPLGYEVCERRLVVNQSEAETVREIFRRYLELGSVRLLQGDLDRGGIVSKVRISKTGNRSGGSSFSRGALYELLSNPIYVGEIRHQKERHPGQHDPIVDRELWERAQQQLRERAARSETQATKAAPSPLAGKLFDEKGEGLYVGGAAKTGRRYRYYVSRGAGRSSGTQTGRHPALAEAPGFGRHHACRGCERGTGAIRPDADEAARGGAAAHSASERSRSLHAPAASRTAGMSAMPTPASWAVVVIAA